MKYFKKDFFVKQHDSMQCGLACLSMICRIYGKRMPLERVAEVAHASSEGISLLGIKEGAAELGFDVIAGKFTLKQLTNLDTPVILHWNQNHFVVLYKSSESIFILLIQQRVISIIQKVNYENIG